MSRYLLAVWSFETHVNPFIAVAVSLRQAGHEVAFYAGPRGAREIAEQQFRIFPFESVSEAAADEHVAGIVRDRKNRGKLRRHWFNFLISQLPDQVKDLNRIITLWQPDVLISDMAMLAPFTILHDQGKVLVAVLSHVGYCMVPGPQGPIPGKAMPPRHSIFSRLKASLVQAVANYVTRDIPPAVDAARERYGLKPTGLRVTEYHARVPLLLIPSVPELDYNRTDLPSSVRYTGGCLWPPPQSVDTEHEFGAASGRPVIVVDEGSLYTEEPFLLRCAVAALSGSRGGSGYDVRVIAGRHRDVSKLDIGPPAANIRISAWRPLEEVAEHASLVITNGNTESVWSALSRGIPVIVVPAILDQTEIAFRVRVWGAGSFIAEAKCNGDSLRAMVETILNNPRYSERARQARNSLAHYSGPPEAVRLLEELAGSRVAS